MRRWQHFFLATVSVFAAACADDQARYAPEEPVQSAPSPAAPADDDDASEDAGSALTSVDGAPTAGRMVHYDATLKLEAKDPEAVVSQAVALVKAAGGYAELETQDAAVLHVPVAAFGDSFEALQKLAKVLDKSLNGADVTEAYRDAVLHRQLIDASLAKLESLLVKAQSATERLALLSEIGELRARLQETDAQIAALKQMAKYSKVTVSVSAPARAVAQVTPAKIGAFYWIDRLTPEQRLGTYFGQRIELSVPQDFVELDEASSWVAASASQALLTATKLPNEPRGDTAFWIEALKKRLAGRFSVVAVEARGAFQVIRLQDLGNEDYRYDVGVYAKDDTLVVAEAFYPDAKEAGRFADKVFASLQSFKGDAL